MHTFRKIDIKGFRPFATPKIKRPWIMIARWEQRKARCLAATKGGGGRARDWRYSCIDYRTGELRCGDWTLRRGLLRCAFDDE
ncbi:hypothetical protein SESBI_15052 [Sesbania bispinosa]|nr:hypothetical protein SESBI_15052 [Sesbania bispinosa]